MLTRKEFDDTVASMAKMPKPDHEKIIQQSGAFWFELCRRLIESESENKRLRKALGTICGMTAPYDAPLLPTFVDMRMVAQQALEGE